jgi:hypothetical protein
MAASGCTTIAVAERAVMPNRGRSASPALCEIQTGLNVVEPMAYTVALPRDRVSGPLRLVLTQRAITAHGAVHEPVDDCVRSR